MRRMLYIVRLVPFAEIQIIMIYNKKNKYLGSSSAVTT